MKKLTIYFSMSILTALSISSCDKENCHDREKKECENRQSWSNETSTTIENYCYYWNDSTNSCDETITITHKDTATYDTCQAMINNGWMKPSEYDECHCNEKNNEMSYWERAEDSTGYNYYHWNDTTQSCDLKRHTYASSCEEEFNQGLITWDAYAECDCESKEVVYNTWNHTQMIPTWNPWTKKCEYVTDSTNAIPDSTGCQVYGMVQKPNGLIVCECIAY